MTDADKRPDLEPPQDAEDTEATTDASERKAFAGGTELGGRKTRTLSEDDSVVLAGLEAAQEQAERLRELAHVRREEMRERIREQPLTAVAATFAGGMILGLLLARRR